MSPAPVPDNSYGSPGEQSQRGPRELRGVLPGTRVGIPGRKDGWPKQVPTKDDRG